MTTGPGQPGPGARFAMHFTSTPRGARLARLLVSRRLDDWGYEYDSETNATATLLAAELAANAVLHGHLPGHDFHLALMSAPQVIRIEVSDARADKHPTVRTTDSGAETGRGIVLIAGLATRWGVTTAADTLGKTVWAEFATPA